jgi:hypothetical protein
MEEKTYGATILQSTKGLLEVDLVHQSNYERIKDQRQYPKFTNDSS